MKESNAIEIHENYSYQSLVLTETAHRPQRIRTGFTEHLTPIRNLKTLIGVSEFWDTHSAQSGVSISRFSHIQPEYKMVFLFFGFLLFFWWYYCTSSTLCNLSQRKSNGDPQGITKNNHLYHRSKTILIMQSLEYLLIHIRVYMYIYIYIIACESRLGCQGNRCWCVFYQPRWGRRNGWSSIIKHDITESDGSIPIGEKAWLLQQQ